MFPQEPFESEGGSRHNTKRIIPPKGFLENALSTFKEHRTPPFLSSGWF
jgi:hypothetical protein